MVVCVDIGPIVTAILGLSVVGCVVGGNDGAIVCRNDGIKLGTDGVKLRFLKGAMLGIPVRGWASLSEATMLGLPVITTGLGVRFARSTGCFESLPLRIAIAATAPTTSTIVSLKQRRLPPGVPTSGKH